MTFPLTRARTPLTTPAPLGTGRCVLLPDRDVLEGGNRALLRVHPAPCTQQALTKLVPEL